MKKALIRLVAVSAALGLGAGVLRLGRTMRAHCEQMCGGSAAASRPPEPREV